MSQPQFQDEEDQGDGCPNVPWTVDSKLIRFTTHLIWRDFPKDLPALRIHWNVLEGKITVHLILRTPQRCPERGQWACLANLIVQSAPQTILGTLWVCFQLFSSTSADFQSLQTWEFFMIPVKIFHHCPSFLYHKYVLAIGLKCNRGLPWWLSS